MIRVEKKKIRNKPYYYLVDQIKVGEKYKKIQVFLGKKVPTDSIAFFNKLAEKERALLDNQIKAGQFKSSIMTDSDVQKIEGTRISWKYGNAQLSKKKIDMKMLLFAINFTYESNAIEGSRLSRKNVAAIVEKKYISKKLEKHDIQEVKNSIDAIDYIRSGKFKLNQKSLKELHSVVVKNLNIDIGFKKEENVVNNRETVHPDDVKDELKKLFEWYIATKKKENEFVLATLFHNKFEHIHPFIDGNGRVGRLIFNWMLLESGYGLIMIKNSRKIAYRNALAKGDEGRSKSLLKFCADSYKKTIREYIS